MYNKILSDLEKKQMKTNITNIFTGDFITIEIYTSDKSKKRLQIFSGIIIAIRNKKLCSSIIVRKYSNGEGVEQTFFIHSKNIKNIIVNSHSKVRKSKLFFLRNRINKSIKIKKKIIKK